MRCTLFLLLALTVARASPVSGDEPKPPSADQLLHEGVRLYDTGDFEGALGRLREALELKPGDPTITYEIGLSLQALKRYAECAALVEPMIAKVERLTRDYYVLAASCIDYGGDPQRAGAVFDAALHDFPEDPELHFNAGVTRLSGKEPKLAKELLKDSVMLRPTHPASHLYLGLAFEQCGFTVPAILAYVRFLTLSPGDARAPAAALAIGRLLGLGIEVKSDGSTNMVIDPEASIEEGDYRQADLMRVMAAAVGTTEENRNKDDVRKFFEALDSLFRFLAEETPGAKPDLARARFLPVAIELQKKGLLESFVYRSLRPLSEEQTKAWLEAHPEKVSALDDFVASHGGMPPRR